MSHRDEPQGTSDRPTETATTLDAFAGDTVATDSHAEFISNLDGTISHVSQSCAEVFGVSESTIVGSSMGEYLPVTRASETVEDLRQQLQRGTPVSRELTLTTASGAQRTVVFTATPVGSGESRSIVGRYVDRTNVHRATEKRNLLTEVSHGIAEADSYLSGLETAVSAICTYTEWAYGEVWTPSKNGDYLEYTLGHTTDRRTEQFQIDSTTVTFDYGEGLPGRVYDSQSSEWIPDTSEKPVDVFHRADLATEADLRAAFAVPVVADGTVLSVVVFFLRDRREVDERLATEVSDVVDSLGGLIKQKQAEAVLKQQNELLDGFASEVAHDLRNPLSVAQGYLEVARDDSPTESLSKVSEALARMEELIENLLTLSHEGNTIGEETPVSLGDVAAAARDNVRTDTATLERNAGRLQADPTRVQQLLENLFRNSVEHGGTAVAVRVGPLEPISTSTRGTRTQFSIGFYVEDDGPGIPPAERDSVFETAYSTGGTGLGLVTVKEIATAHGWEATCTASQDGGARFEFRETDSPNAAERGWTDRSKHVD